MDRQIYLDNGATSWPKPREQFDKMVDLFMQIGVSPGRGSYDQAVSAQEYIRQAREKVAGFFGGPDPERVIFTANATDGLNLALLGTLAPGDHVVTTATEHNSVLRPLYHLQKTREISTSVVPFDGQGIIDPEDIKKTITPRTSLVAVNHASNVLGSVQPVAEIGEICAAHGIPLLVDASQSGGQIPVNMAKMQASALVFTGHKSLYGPTGIGGLLLGPDFTINSTRFGGTGLESKSLVHTQTFPHRLEAGTHNLMGIIGLSLAIDNLLQLGLERLHDKEINLAAKLYDGLDEISGIELYGGPITLHHVALFSANIPPMHPDDLGAILDADFNIAVRSGLHCAPLVHEILGTGGQGTIRFSLGRFNTEKEIDLVIKAMYRIARRN
ncbi:cysteine desulfurase [Desulforhopalus singaporensis]|uniref:cysteine desulfurase n=1 Tax=Desulforhopalus singaporensis TaxID=91360 RepID=A0A1H0RLH5_9BACT|nr:cysteine desulfurase [Desulforhopalus singaporensis]SDP30327.1 cysteine desulfurase family protein [Desulforhopalus singaporensis]